MDRPGRVRRRRGPWDRPVERPVDLDRRRIELERAASPSPLGAGGRPDRGDSRTGSGRRRRPRQHDPRGTSPAAVRTPVTRPRSTSMRTTSWDVRISPPSDSNRRRQRPGQFTGAALRHREAHGLAEHAQQDAHQPRARCIERDVGMAGIPGDQDPGRHPTEAPSSDVAGGREHGLDEARPPTFRRRAKADRPDFTGGNGDNREPTIWSPIRSQSAHRASQAAPSPGWASSISPAVIWRSLCRIAQLPSGKGWPSAAGACRHVRPCVSRPKDWMVGEAAARG